MAEITTYELVSGHTLSGGHSTTVGDAFSRGDASSTDSGDSGNSGGSDSGTPAPPAPRTTSNRPLGQRDIAGRRPLARHERERPYASRPDPDSECRHERGRRGHHPRCDPYAPRTLRK